MNDSSAQSKTSAVESGLMIRVAKVERFPIERRLTRYREHLFDENVRYPVTAMMSNEELDALAERIVRVECPECGDPFVYAKIRVGLGKARDRARARGAGVHGHDFDLWDEELVELEADLYVCRRGVAGAVA